MQAAKSAAGARRQEDLRRFERGLEELASLLVDWPDVEPQLLSEARGEVVELELSPAFLIDE